MNPWERIRADKEEALQKMRRDSLAPASMPNLSKPPMVAQNRALKAYNATPIPKDLRGMKLEDAFPMQDSLDRLMPQSNNPWWMQPGAPMWEEDAKDPFEPVAKKELTPPSWGEVVPNEKRPTDRLSGLPVPVVNPWERARQPNRVGFYNPQTGDRTLEDFAKDVSEQKLSWPEVEDAMKTLTKEEKKTLYLDMLSHPPRSKFKDKPPVGKPTFWNKQMYRDYET